MNFFNTLFSPKKVPVQTIDKDKKLKKLDKLSPREFEVFTLLVEGFKLREIAERLSVAYATVNTHSTAIYKKLGVNSRPSLIIEYRNVVKAEE